MAQQPNLDVHATRCIFDALVPKGKKKMRRRQTAKTPRKHLPNTHLDQCAIDENCLNSPSEAHSQHSKWHFFRLLGCCPCCCIDHSQIDFYFPTHITLPLYRDRL